MMKRLAALAAMIMLALGLSAAPAQAAASDCLTNYFCIWTSTNYTGSRYQWHVNTLVDSYHNGVRLGSGISNRGYSFYNHISGSEWAVNIYDSGNCAQSPWYRTMQPGQKATAQGSDWGGRVSSIQLWNASPLTC